MLGAVMAPDGELAANYGATEAMPSTELGSREHLDGLWDLTEQGAGVCNGCPAGRRLIIDIVGGPIESIGDTAELSAGASVKSWYGAST